MGFHVPELRYVEQVARSQVGIHLIELRVLPDGEGREGGVGPRLQSPVARDRREDYARLAIAGVMQRVGVKPFPGLGGEQTDALAAV